MTIASLHVENFQSHVNSHLNFADGVNTIVGTSDGGKSAILRALNWVVTNRPTGEAFRNWQGGDTVVTVVTEDGRAVERERAGKKNEYRVFDDKGDTVALKAVGQDVPAEVNVALRLGDINIQYQLDSPFLLSRDWSPGRVAEYLNEIVGLDAIDRAQETVDSRLRRLRQQIVAGEVDVKTEKQAVADLAYIDDLDAAVAATEMLSAEAGRVRDEEQKLFAAINAVQAIQGLLSSFFDYRQAERKVVALMTSAVSSRELNAVVTAWQQAIEAIAQVQNRLDVVTAILQAEADINQLVAEHDKLMALDDEYNRLAAVTNNCQDVADKIAAVEPILRGSRLVDYVSQQEQLRLALINEVNLLEAVAMAIHETEEFVKMSAGKLMRFEADWEKMTPNICPLCDGRGILKEKQ